MKEILNLTQTEAFFKALNEWEESTTNKDEAQYETLLFF